MRGKRLVAALAVVACTAVTACGDGDDPPPDSPATGQSPGSTPGPSPGDRVDVAGETANYHSTEDITGTTRVTIDMEDTYFSPTVLKGKPGQKLQVTLRNRGEDPHHFTTADQQLIVEVQPGLTAEGRITLPSSGNLSFYCLLHREDGMAGAFNVSGPVTGAEAKPEPTATR